MNDRELKQLALQTQEYPLGTTDRQIALSKLLDGIWSCKSRFCRPYNSTDAFQGAYEEIYQQGVCDLILWLNQNIEKYDPQKGEVMAWLNFLLKKQFFPTAIRKVIGEQEIRIGLPGQPDEFGLPGYDFPDLRIDEDDDCDTPALEKLRKIIRYVKLDPKRTFSSTRIPSHSHVSFQNIALKRWSGIRWKDISKEWSVPISTVSQFYYENLEKFRNELGELF